MKVLILGRSCNPKGGGTPSRIFGLTRIAAGVADVTFLSTYDPTDPGLEGVKFYHRAVPENLFSKVTRLASYYRTRYGSLELDCRPDIIQIEGPQYFALRRQFPETPVILDEHNVWWQLAGYNIAEGPTLRKLPVKKLWRRWLLSRAKKYEIEALNQSSHVIACSDVDRREFLKELPHLGSRITVIPNCLDVDRYTVSDGEKDIVLFMGPLNYFPNRDAARLICQEIAPRVRAEFHVLGSGSLDIDPPRNVHLIGDVGDIQPYLREAKVCIAPLRWGSGVRVKILESMASGKAVVSTAKGAEGIEVTPGKDILIADDMEMFARAIKRLLEDQALRREMGRKARDLIEEKYDYRKYADPLLSIYRRVLERQ